MQIVLLAAGRGSRLPSKYRKSPKNLVKIKNKTIFEINLNFYTKFKDRFLVTGYKRNLFQTLITKYRFKEIINFNYSKTNMVQSLMLTYEFLKKNEDIVVCYGDIIFDKNIFKKFINNKGNIIIGNTNWMQYWRKRMSEKKIFCDAESFRTKDGYLKEIGMKLSGTPPKLQYMGLFKISYNDFKKVYLFYKKIKKRNIDMTSFLNNCIQKKIIKIKVKRYSGYWHEIDNAIDIKIAKKDKYKW